MATINGNYNANVTNLQMGTVCGQDVKNVLSILKSRGNNWSSGGGSNITGDNYVVIDSDDISQMQITDKSQLDDISNKTFIITANINLNGEVLRLPYNSTLWFLGGSFTNGKIWGAGSNIIADYKIFNNVKVLGIWKCVGDIRWWATGRILKGWNFSKQCNVPWGVLYKEAGEKSWCLTSNFDLNSMVGSGGDSADIQSALDSSFRELVFAPVPYYIDETLVLNKEKKLTLQGSDSKMPLSWQIGSNSKTADKNNAILTFLNTTTLFTNLNITILDISINETANADLPNTRYNKGSIIGGNFDVSLCSNYTNSVIKVSAEDDQHIWGLDINTNITNEFFANTGIGIDINPTESTSGVYSKAYVTDVNINSSINFFETGIKARDWTNNWTTDLTIDGYIHSCKTAVDTNVGCVINASIQDQASWWDTFHNNGGCIKVSGSAKVAVGGHIYDFAHPSTGFGTAPTSSTKYGNRYAVIASDSAQVIPFGHFAIFFSNGGVREWDGSAWTWHADRAIIKCDGNNSRLFAPVLKMETTAGGANGGNTSEYGRAVICQYSGMGGKTDLWNQV